MLFKKLSRCALAAIVVSVFTPSSTAQQFPASDPFALFVPGDQVPLSQFVAGSAGISVDLNVRPAILQWLQANNQRIEVAVHTSAGVVDVQPDSVHAASGVVTYTPSVDAELVVVSNALVNDFPVVTHWNASLNDPDGAGPLPPRGGQQVGATDGIGTIDYDPVTGEVSSSGGSHKSGNPAHAHPSGDKYKFSTDLYALFSDGTETTPVKDGEPADADVPSYERYIAENFALIAITDLRAVYLSDLSRHSSGLPIAHRNHPTAFDSNAPAKEQLQAGLPIIQIVHCFIAEYDDPMIPAVGNGAEDSLATFLVPPMWTPSPATDYPVLFNSFYGIHRSTFGGVGLEFLDHLGALYTIDGRQAIGILHNGGGGVVSQSSQGSLVHNVRIMFEAAESELGVDVDNVVITGGSRGGVSGLHLASNPGVSGFRARYVIAGNPETYLGDAIERFQNASYPLLQTGSDLGTGYKGSWRVGWIDPVTLRPGREQAAFAFTGSDDFAYIDANLANGSPPFVAKLLERGTKVILRLGTHDYTKPFLHMSEYMEALIVAGVPLRAEIGHRFGHGNALGTQPDERELLNRVIDGNLTLATGVFHYRPLTDQDELDYVGHEFTPAHAPVFLEAPMRVSVEQNHTYVITGPPGAEYEIWGVQIDPDAWLSVTISDITPPPGPTFTGTLPLSAPGVTMTSAVHSLAFPYLENGDDPSIGSGPWRLEVHYRLNSSSPWTVIGENMSMPTEPMSGTTPAPTVGVLPSSAFWAPFYDLAPVINFLDTAYSHGSLQEVVGLHIDSRVGGLSEDADL